MEELFKQLGVGGGGGEAGGSGGGVEALNMPGGSQEGLEKMLEGVPGLEGMNKEEMMGHASRLWKFMDELAEDPEAYKEFLDKQAAAAGVSPAPPGAPGQPQPPPPRSATLFVTSRFQRAPKQRPPMAPGSPVVTLGTPGPMVHAVVAMWRAPPGLGLRPAHAGDSPLTSCKPPSDWRKVEVPCKMRVAPFEERTTEGKSAIIYEVNCSSETLALAAEDSPFASEFRPVLVELVFRWLEKEHDILLSRTNRQMRVLTKEGTPEPDGSEVAAGTAAAGVSPGLLSQLTNLGDASPKQPTAAASFLDPQRRPSSGTSARAMPLVQEIEPEGDGPAGAAAASKQPLTYKVSEQSGGSVQVVIDTPAGMKASDFDVDVSSSQLCIAETPTTQQLTVQLSTRVDPDTVRAKVDKKKRLLTVTMGLLPV